jgi:hypothetical protein
MGSQLFTWMVLLLLCLPTGAVGQGGFDAGIPNPEAGRADPAQSVAMPDLPGHEDLVALNRHYADQIKDLKAEARMAMDPAYVEQLQKQIQELKAEHENALIDLQIEIVLQKGDEDRVLQLGEARQFLDYSAQQLLPPDSSEPTQRPEHTATRRRVKNPDDE